MLTVNPIYLLLSLLLLPPRIGTTARSPLPNLTGFGGSVPPAPVGRCDFAACEGAGMEEPIQAKVAADTGCSIGGLPDRVYYWVLREIGGREIQTDGLTIKRK